MTGRRKSLWLNLPSSLGFIPGLLAAAFALGGVLLVELDKHVQLGGVAFVFQGDGSAARTVLSVIAGSLITVAGLTFSITMVVLQLAASQFSSRILRTFFGDRITQVTIGTYVGTFVYAILVLRAVGSYGDAGFVPRLSVTLACLLGIAAVVLLIVFLHHTSQMIQVSHVTASVARGTLARAARLYPHAYGAPVEEVGADDLLERWRAEPPAQFLPTRPGFVQHVDLDQLADRLGGSADRVAILVCPGDFASLDSPFAEVWPRTAAEACRAPLRAAVLVADERDLRQDVDFGIRQLADTAIKAMSPGINDPMTAVTCIGYLRSLLVFLTQRAPPPGVRSFPKQGLTMVTRRRELDVSLESLVQIGRYARADAWVAWRAAHGTRRVRASRAYLRRHGAAAHDPGRGRRDRRGCSR
jgi:uncharacterized membrane protein